MSCAVADCPLMTSRLEMSSGGAVGIGHPLMSETRSVEGSRRAASVICTGTLPLGSAWLRLAGEITCTPLGSAGPWPGNHPPGPRIPQADATSATAAATATTRTCPDRMPMPPPRPRTRPTVPSRRRLPRPGRRPDAGGIVVHQPPSVAPAC